MACGAFGARRDLEGLAGVGALGAQASGLATGLAIGLATGLSVHDSATAAESISSFSTFLADSDVFVVPVVASDGAGASCKWVFAWEAPHPMAVSPLAPTPRHSDRLRGFPLEHH